MIMRHYYVFFRRLPDLLMAMEFKPIFLEDKDDFGISGTHTFILWKSIDCKAKTIEAAKENPLFGAVLSIIVGEDITDTHNEQYYQRYKYIMKEFKQQPFSKSGILCKQRNIDYKWHYRIEGGALILKDAKYFPSIISMTQYSHKNDLIDMDHLDEQERKLIELELRMPEIFEDDFSKAKIIEKFD